MYKPRTLFATLDDFLVAAAAALGVCLDMLDPRTHVALAQQEGVGRAALIMCTSHALAQAVKVPFREMLIVQ
eukprot:scaffold134877_cov19-Tisochrysis_lutea.AAC.2